MHASQAIAFLIEPKLPWRFDFSAPHENPPQPINEITALSAGGGLYPCLWKYIYIRATSDCFSIIDKSGKKFSKPQRFVQPMFFLSEPYIAIARIISPLPLPPPPIPNIPFPTGFPHYIRMMAFSECDDYTYFGLELFRHGRNNRKLLLQ